MTDYQIYIIYTIGAFHGIRQYLFECKGVEFYKEDMKVIADQFYATTGIKPIQEQVIDVDEAPFIFYAKAKDAK